MNCEIAIYTAIFGSTKLEEPEPTPTSEPTPEPTPEPAPTPEPEQPADEKDSGTDWPSLLGCVGGVAGLTAAAFFGVNKIKERSVKK